MKERFTGNETLKEILGMVHDRKEPCKSVR